MENEYTQLNPRFEKNISALATVNLSLTVQLFELTEHARYEIFQGKDPIDINLLDTQTNTYMYDHSPSKEAQAFLEAEDEKLKIPFRFFFGIGNGVILNALLGQPFIKRVVIIEPSIELVYIAFHLLDFSPYLLNKKLYIETGSNLNYSSAYNIIMHDEGKVYAKLFTLETFSSYYEKVFMDEYIRINKTFTDALYSLIAGHGNCPIDSLMGLSHHLKNLPQMVRSAKIKYFSNKKNTNIAIVVSTGPSLSKQLPLLKSIQDYVTIICVDASFPILEKHGIKPDFVTVLERIPETAAFFENNDPSFQEGVHFVLVSMVHEKVIKSIKTGNTILEMRPNKFTKHFNLDEFGYLGSGMSAANLAHELGYLIGATHIVLIGQDLAFGEDNSSHAEGHVYGEDEEKTAGHELFVEKYGGGGTIRTTHYWILFRNYFERAIDFATRHGITKTINATEGGARIPGAIEMPFQEMIDTLVDTTETKKPIPLEFPSPEETFAYEEQFIAILNEWIADSVEKQEQTEKVFLSVQKMCETLIKAKENHTLERITLQDLLPYLDQIDSIKVFFEDITFSERYIEVVQTYILPIELDLVSIPLQKATSEEEKIAKAVDWIMKHRYWLFSLAGGFQAIRDTMIQAIETWEPRLKEKIIVPEKKEAVEK